MATSSVSSQFRSSVVQALQTTPQGAINYGQLIEQHGVSQDVATEVSESILGQYCVHAFKHGPLNAESSAQIMEFAQTFGITDNRVKEIVLRSQASEPAGEDAVDDHAVAALDDGVAAQPIGTNTAGVFTPLVGITRTSLAPETIEALRLKLVDLFGSMPDEELSFLADETTASRGAVLPVYAAEVHALYETRTFEEVFRPHNITAAPVDRGHTTPQNVKPWDYQFGETTVFTDQEHDHDVADSRHVETCHTCSGKTKVTCEKCTGSGNVTCGRCSGTGTKECPSCQGGGQVNDPIENIFTVPCGVCQAAAIANMAGIPTLPFCAPCKNTGVIEKRELIDNWVSCQPCSASGEVACATCTGNGVVTCKTCTGTGLVICVTCTGNGRLIWLIVVTRHLKVTIDDASYADPAMDNDGIPQLVDDDFVTLVHCRHSRFTQEMVDPAEPEALRVQLQQALTTIASREHDENRVHQMMLRIRHAMVDLLDYELRRQKYRAWFLGADKRVHAPDSPATASVVKKATQALDDWQRKDFLAAMPIYRTCIRMAKTNEACHKELQSFEMENPSKLYFWARKIVPISIVAGVVTIFVIVGLVLVLF